MSRVRFSRSDPPYALSPVTSKPSPSDPVTTHERFWQGIRLRTESEKTEYDEINVATGNVVGSPGFSIPLDSRVTHASIVEKARDAALRLLTA